MGEQRVSDKERYRFSVDVGWLAVGEAERRIREAAWVAGLEYFIERRMGWMGGTLLVEYVGTGAERAARALGGPTDHD